MNNNLEGKSKDIIKVLLWIDVIFLIISVFYVSKGLMIFSLIINIVFIGSFFIIEKNSGTFDNMIEKQKVSKGLNDVLGKLNG